MIKRLINISNTPVEPVMLKHAESNVLNAIKSSGKVLVPMSGGYKCFFPEEILYLMADINYTKIFLQNGDNLLVSKTLKVFLEDLPSKTFYRVHRSYIINSYHIEFIKINNHESYIRLKGDVNIPVSRKNRNQFLFT